LEQYRFQLFGSAVFSGPEGEAQVQELIREWHPGLKYDSRLARVVMDFGKMVLQEIVEESVEVMERTGSRVLDTWVIEQASWRVSDQLWRTQSL
jgi:hypothetical protein